LFSFDLKDVGAAVVGEMSDFGGLYYAKNFEKLIFRGLHEKHARQRGIWVPTQHSLWDHGKPCEIRDWSMVPTECDERTEGDTGRRIMFSGIRFVV
jgi:hypothetical protein